MLTLWRWLFPQKYMQEYQAAFFEAQQRAVAQAIANLRLVAGQAVNTLSAVMEDPEARGSEKVAAARVVLEMVFKVTELEELEARVDALEQALQGKGDSAE